MLHKQSLTGLRDMLRRREVSSVELTSHFLDRIKKHKDLNAFITLNEEDALDAARKADIELGQGNYNDLTGVPIAQKDIFCTKGIKTSCGSKMLSNFISPYDSTVTINLKNAGSVLLGKTNMDEFAMGSSNETSYYGSVLNPWNKEYVPGGSSGGSASSVAARIIPAATGTDTGGSIRQPAAFCGITGIKPSYGRVSRYGMIAFASSLDQGGPIAQSAEDAALMLKCMEGFDPHDSTSVKCEELNLELVSNLNLKGLRLGIPKEFCTSSIQDDVMSNIDDALKILTKSGAELVEVSLPNSNSGIPCYYVLAPAEASSNLARYDGVRFGHRAEDIENLADLYEKSRSEGFGEEVKRRILIGTFVLSSGYYDAYYLKAQKIRRLISDDFNEAFKSCDIIVGPTSPTTAFKLGEKIKDPVTMYLNDIFTNTVNLAGLPGISIPAGFDKKNLPVGLQLIGKYMDDSRILGVAHHYQKISDWHTLVPRGY